jgi:hypothetical protein
VGRRGKIDRPRCWSRGCRRWGTQGQN